MERRDLKNLKIFVFALCLLIFPMGVSATFIDNNTNLSAEWTRMQARTGSFDSMDAITYNPAGTVKMEDGFYLSLQNQVLPKAYSHKYNGEKYEADNTTFFVPGFFAMNKKGKWSQFAGINVIGGGGSLEYPDSIYTKNGYCCCKPDSWKGKYLYKCLYGSNCRRSFKYK